MAKRRKLGASDMPDGTSEASEQSGEDGIMVALAELGGAYFEVRVDNIDLHLRRTRWEWAHRQFPKPRDFAATVRKLIKDGRVLSSDEDAYYWTLELEQDDSDDSTSEVGELQEIAERLHATLKKLPMPGAPAARALRGELETPRPPEQWPGVLRRLASQPMFFDPTTRFGDYDDDY